MLEQITYRIKHQDCCPQKHLRKVQLNALWKLTQAFLREEILSASYEGNKLLFTLPKTTRILYVDTIQLGSLARYRTFGNLYIQANNGSVREITNPLELLDICISELGLEYDNGKWKKFSQEIDDHLRNALLSSYKSCNLAKRIAQEAVRNQCPDFLRWLEMQKEISDPVIFFEQWASRGHPYHPCSKTKLGFSIEDVLNYSPEFHPEVPIKLAAVRYDYMHIEAMLSGTSYTIWFKENFPDVWEQWLKAIAEKQLDPHAYVPVPIHPWQAEKKLPDIFGELLATGILHLLDVTIMAGPTLSFRSLAPLKRPRAPYIKLPVAVQATSVFRTLSPGSTENTPKISHLLQGIFAAQHNFDGRLMILHEVFGLHLRNIPDEQGRHLTAIFRENPNIKLANDETAIVLAALFEKSPVTDRTLFIELMHVAGVMTLEQAIDYFHRYVDLVLGGYLDLYLIYGIALEGHQQNTLAVFSQSKIVRFIARDFDGTDLHIDTLQSHGLTLRTYPGSPNAWEDRKHVRNSLLHSVYQSHLGELVLLLANHFRCDENYFWQIVREVTLTRFAALKHQLTPADWETEYQAILEEEWPCKALLRMRLQKKYSPEGLFFKIANPLSLAS